MREMKKSVKFLLALALVIFAFAVKGDMAKAATIYDTNNNEVDAVEPKVLATGSEDEVKKATTSFMFALDGTDAVPLKIKKEGTLMFYAASASENGVLNIYSDKECTDVVTSAYTNKPLDNGGYMSDATIVYLKAGTYYLNTDEANIGTYELAGMIYPSGDRTLTSGKWVITAPKSSSAKLYYKIKVSKQSKITVQFDAGKDPSVALCNSSKKAISETDRVGQTYGYKAYYAVKPGTYYIRVQSEDSWYRVKATVKAVNDSTGSSKSKAKTMKYNGGKITGVLLASDKTSKIDWLRISNPKTQASNVYFESEITSGSAKLEAIASNGKSMGSLTYNSIKPNGVAQLYTIGSGYSGTTLAKGTYYVKIKKNSAKTSAVYKVYLKNK